MEQIQLYLMADARNVKIVDADLNANNTLFTLFKCVPVEIYLHLFNLDGTAYTYDELNSRVWSFVIADDYNNKTAPQLRADEVEVLEDGIVKITISEMNTIELDTALGEEKAVRLGAELFGKLKGDTNDNWVMQWNCSVRNRRDSAGEPTGIKSDYYTKSEVDSIISDITVDTTNFYTKAEIDDKLENITIDTSNFYTKNEVDLALGAKADLAELDKYQLSANAFSGDYNELTNKPNIPVVPQVVSAFQNDAGYITLAEVPTTDLSNYALKTDIPDVSNFITSDALTPYAKINYVDGQLTTKANVSELANYALKSEIPVVPTKTSELQNDSGYITLAQVPTTDLTNYYVKSEVDGKLDLKLNITDAFSGSYNDLTDKPVIPVLPENITTLGNNTNVANGLVLIGEDGKIPSNLYDADSSIEYTAGNGITITDDVIAANLANYTGNISLNTATGSYSGYYITANNTTFMIRNKSQSMMNMYCSASYAMFGSDPTRTSYTILKGKNIFGSISYNKCTPLLPMLIEGGVVTNSYTAQNSHTGDLNNTSTITINSKGGTVHTITLTAETACTLTVPWFGSYLTLMVIVDNAAGGSLLFGDEEIINQTETGKYALVFSCLTATTVKLYNKIEV